MNKKLDEILKNIIQYSTRISVLYQNIATAKIEDNKEEYQRQLDYIALAEEYEEKEYKKINFDKELSEGLYKRFYCLLEHSDTPPEIYNQIYQRFQNHINEILIRNPFPSRSPLLIEKITEDNASIIWQAMRDYSISALYFMDKDIKLVKNEAVRQDLIDYYYEFIFKQKILNKYLKEPPKEIETSGRNRCLELKQDKNRVKECYVGTIMESLSIYIPSILRYTDEFIITHPNQLAEHRYFLNLLKASIAIATEEEKKGIRIAYTDFQKQNSKISIQRIDRAIEEANLTVQDKIAQKKKSPGKPN